MTFTGIRSTAYRYKVHHVIFWMLYYVFWIFAYRHLYPLRGLMVVTLAYGLFNALSFYTIAYWIIPRFLNRGRYALFFLWGLAVVLFCAFDLAVALYLIFQTIIQATVPTPFSAMFMIALISTGTMTGILTAGKMILEKIRADRQQNKKEKQRLEAELQFLRAQVNPHFLFNAINSVYFLIYKNPTLAAETLIKLSDLLRFQLYDCSDELIPVEKELEYVQNFIALEKLRKGDQVKVQYTTTGTLGGFRLAPFMLIPFLENAFKFVSSSKSTENIIDIHLSREGDTFIAAFMNTHEHVPMPGQVGGIGLTNVRRRLDLLYPGQYTLEIQPGTKNFYVSLKLPVVS